ncbi:MAG TPA: glycosyltransferase family 39 protein [Bacteroidota bacterium]|nr:glycosyltransferase family 39 protein [Bacteroidota bacterium]
MKAHHYILFVISIAFILSPVIFFPPSEIQTKYMTEGIAILQGNFQSLHNTSDLSLLSKIVYGGIGIISNTNSFSARIIEFFIHLLTAIALFFLVKKYLTKSKAVLASIIYVLSIVLLNYKFSFQIEPLSNILIIALIALHLKRDNINSEGHINTNYSLGNYLSLLLEGLIIGLILFLKFNFVFLIIGILAYDIFFLNINWQKIIKKYGPILAGFIIFAALYLFILKVEKFPNAIASLFQSITIPHISFTFIRDFLKDFAKFLAYIYSVLFIIALFYSILNWLKNLENYSKDIKSMRLFGISFYLAIAIILSFVLYQDFQFNHIASLFIPFCILISDGLVEIYHKFINVWGISKFSYKFVLVMFVCFLLLFSPLHFWIYYMQYPFIYLIFHNYAVLI